MGGRRKNARAHRAAKRKGKKKRVDVEKKSPPAAVTLLPRKLSWPVQALLSTWGLIVIVVGFLSGVVTLYLWTSDSLAPAEIHPDPGEADDPFVLRFTIRNPSKVFDMRDVKFVCAIGQIGFTKPMVASNSDLGLITDMTIPSGRLVAYSCPIMQQLRQSFGNVDFGQIYSAEIKIRVEYKTLWHGRRDWSELLTWKLTTRRWTEGKLIN